MSLGSMLHVNFINYPCRRGLRGQGPYSDMMQISHPSSWDAVTSHRGGAVTTTTNWAVFNDLGDKGTKREEELG